MGHFLDIAYRVLSTVKRPLSAIEITEYGLKSGWLKSNGQSPSQTMKSKLSTDILKKKSDSLFMRTEQGKFALRANKNNEKNEYIADRFQKAILNEDIAVFPVSSLKKYIPGPGFYTKPLVNGKELLIECTSMSRVEAEKDFNFIQLVSVFLVRFGPKYLTYKRTKRLPENRLHGFYSIGFGGHINIKEIRTLFNVFDPANSGILIRELMEELRLDSYRAESTVYKGLLFDDSKEISSQHLGIVYDVFLDSDKYEIGERGFLVDPKFESIEEMSNRIDEFENWSAIMINFEKKNLNYSTNII
ncbi:hypothetical protein HGB07_04810 [Candidatus Roizmanbacteria bacterium]|nr:hypothetical protein [Candidatus Roizmanbacteria bacterium]